MAELSVGINGKMEGLQKALTDSEKALKQFESKANGIKKSLESNALSSAKLEGQINSLKASFASGAMSQKKFESSLKSLQVEEGKVSQSSKLLRADLSKVNTTANQLGGKGMNTLKRGTASGNSAMTAFSRTIQDAPFGIMGVSNNITNLTEQFGYLKNKTGSSSGALKAMLKDMRGFGGITLAISIATSLLLVYGDQIFAASKRTKELKKINDEFVSSLGSSFTRFKILTDVLLDTNSSLKDQKKAIRVLNKDFKDFDTSIISNGKNYAKAKIAVDAYSASLIAQAKATAGLSLISEKQAQILVLEEKKLLKMRNSFGSATVEQFEKRRQTLLSLNNRQLKDNKDLSSSELETLRALRKKRAEEINKRFDDVKRGGEKEIKVLQNSIDRIAALSKIKDLVLGGGKLTGGKEKIGKYYEEVGTEYLDKSAELQELMELNPITLADGLEGQSIDWEAYFANKKLEEQAKKVKANLEDFNTDLNNIAEMSLSNTLSTLGSSIGEAVANGGNALKAMGNGILSSLGGFLGSLGKMMIQYGVAAVAYSLASKALLNPLTALPAAGALIAAGVVLSAVGGAISSSVSSGSSSGSGGSSVSSDTGSYSPSGGTSSSSNGNGGGGTYVFEIQGTKLVGVLSNTLARNRSLGGSLSLT